MRRFERKSYLCISIRSRHDLRILRCRVEKALNAVPGVGTVVVTSHERRALPQTRPSDRARLVAASRTSAIPARKAPAAGPIELAVEGMTWRLRGPPSKRA